MKIALIAAIAVVILVSGCIQGSPELRELADSEVREVDGQFLSSLLEFRENSIKGPQYIDIESYTLEVSGLVDSPKSYTYGEVLDRQKYSKVVTLYCVEGWSVTILWEGVLLEDLFEEAGIQSEANTVIFHSYDGYTTSLPLDYILEKDIILAYKMNGLTLPPERGFPFQVVAEEKYGYKWAKWPVRIELSNDPAYRGYWESRGYDIDADVGGPIFEGNF